MYPVTCLSIVVCVVLFFLIQKEERYERDTTILSQYSLIPMQVKRGQWYRLFTSAFLHRDPAHLVMNMIALYNLGSLLERILGPYRFFAALLFSILGGSLFVTMRSKPMTRTIGISGGLYGLLMVYFIFLWRAGLLMNTGIRAAVLRTVLINLMISFMPGVSLNGHVGGSLAGILIGIIFTMF